MPELSRFLGIIITMYFREHGPPHFHARQGDFRAAFAIEGLEIVEGRLPRRVTALVLEGRLSTARTCSTTGAGHRSASQLKPVRPLE